MDSTAFAAAGMPPELAIIAGLIARHRYRGDKIPSPWRRLHHT